MPHDAPGAARRPRCRTSPPSAPRGYAGGVTRRKRLLIVLIFLVAVAGPVLWLLLRPAPVAPTQPPPTVPEPIAVAPPPPPPPPPPVEPPPPPAPDPAVLEAERLAKRRASAIAAFERGLALQRKGDHAASIREYQEAVELDETLAGAWTNMGLAYGKTGRAVEGLPLARRALGLQALERTERRAHAYWVIGVLAAEAGDTPGAAAAFTDALKANPAHASAAMHLARLQAANGQMPAAAATLRSAATAAAPSDPAAAANLYANLAAHHIEQGEHAQAADAAQAALRTAPDHPQAKRSLGMAQLSLQRWGDAAQNLDEAARAEPNDADLQVALGYAYERLGRREDALAAFERAIALKPDHPEALQNRAATLDRMGAASPEAKAAFERVQADPRTASRAAQLRLAVLAAREANWPEARRLAEPLVSAEPTNAQARYVLGLACFHLDDKACASNQEYELTLLDSERAAALRALITRH